MPINQLVQFCLDEYKKTGRCVNCKNDCKCLDTDDCYECLKYIHKINTNDRIYNCPNLIYNYVIKHIYRYSSEIECLFDAYEGFKGCKTFKVCSIGCGPCSELFGLKQYITKNNIQADFEYKGFDTNSYWNVIHHKISEIMGNTISFTNEDVFTYYEQHPDELPNVLILNYVLSDIVAFNRIGVTDFITNLLNLFEKMPNSCLIINDINYYEKYTERIGTWRAVNYMNQIFEKLSTNEYFRYYKNKHYFSAQNGTGLTYGVQHKNKRLTTNIIQKAYLYAPFEYCGSFQLFILKHKL